MHARWANFEQGMNRANTAVKCDALKLKWIYNYAGKISTPLNIAKQLLEKKTLFIYSCKCNQRSKYRRRGRFVNHTLVNIRTEKQPALITMMVYDTNWFIGYWWFHFQIWTGKVRSIDQYCNSLIRSRQMSGDSITRHAEYTGSDFSEVSPHEEINFSLWDYFPVKEKFNSCICRII